MTRAGIGVIGIFCTVLGTPATNAGDLSSYRGFHFGMSVAAAAKAAGTKPTDARMVHQRPVLIEEMEWQPHPGSFTDSSRTDPVRTGLLCFFNGELSRIVVIYDRFKIEGMTADDMIEGISAVHGVATRPSVEIPYHTVYAEKAAVVARWEDSEYSYNLVRTGDQSSFAMILYSKRLDALAQEAIVQSVLLEAQEAPQRELEQQKKLAEEQRLVLEKARSVNKHNFRP